MGFFDFLAPKKTSATKHARNRPPRETRGPVVQTGPTAGFNRSRTQAGTWRKKRSDAA